MTMTTITNEIAVAYSLCQRKAFLLLHSEDKGAPHDYLRVIDEQAHIARTRYLKAIDQDNTLVSSGDTDNILNGTKSIVRVTLKFHDLEAYCDLLTRLQSRSSQQVRNYEPTLVVGTHQITKEQKLELSYVGYILGRVQNELPVSGTLVGAGGQAYRVKLDDTYRTLVPLMESLRKEVVKSPSEVPPVMLNKHCPLCQFRDKCLRKAEGDDDLSLLDRMTSKIIQRYHEKGIFTVTQMSHLFQPRRNRKRPTKTPLPFKFELQALAIRTRKIYLQEPPKLPRHKVELFMDIEGVPDQKFHYLIGLLVCEEDNSSYYYFWANTPADEQQIWAGLTEKMNQYPEAPIYHYGSYESKAVDMFARTQQKDCDSLKRRLVNLNSCIYGKIYFPVMSNSLKELGKFIGASWTSPDASGLQSLVWRHRWEETGDDKFKEALVTYNKEDCVALRLLTDEISKIVDSADARSNVDFADRPKQNSTETGSQIHQEFERIIRYAHADYDRKRVKIRPERNAENSPERKRGPSKGHQAYQRIIPSNSGTPIQVAPKRKCPKHKGEALVKSQDIAEKSIIDLHFTKKGCRKTVTKYIGTKAYCQKCDKYYNPPKIEKLGNQLFGHAFQAWTIYQRIVLRLPYRIIIQVMEDLFNERTSIASAVNFMKYFAEYYASTERLLIQRLLESPFIHVDETKISIQGTDHYVWVFTNGNHVVFRMTETRESTVVHEFLSNFEGVLISDFYGGYDSLECRQQKCLIHLIRDLNEDLWKAPYNRELECFIGDFKNLLLPMLAAAEKYGLRRRHLDKFKEPVEQFFKKNINPMSGGCELVAKYQKRFQRYRQSLFTFLQSDGIPWHNNTAEKALRHLAVQRKISGAFFKRVALQYLLLLGIGQTCRFQNKSLLKFLLSEEKDVDKFRGHKQVRISMPVGSLRNHGEE
jgi:predicted RecB family nuclease